MHVPWYSSLHHIPRVPTSDPPVCPRYDPHLPFKLVCLKKGPHAVLICLTCCPNWPV